MSKQQLSTIIIGCGRIAGGYDEATAGETILTHASAYNNDGRFQLTACVEPNYQRRMAFAKHWRIESSYATLGDCLNKLKALDIASICSPTSTHESILEELLYSSVRVVFCEKPMTGIPQKSKELGEAYKRAGKKICVNYLRRWDPEMHKIHHELRSGKWGAIRSVTAFYTKGLLHTGSHMLDLIQYFIGPLSPRMILRQTNDFSDDDPTVDAVFNGPANVPVYLIGGPWSDYSRFEAEIICELGIIGIEDSGFRVRRRRTASHRLFPDTIHIDEGSTTNTNLNIALKHAVANIHDATFGKAELVSDPFNAHEVEALCHDLLRMQKTGERYN